jgi:hypothetical protein
VACNLLQKPPLGITQPINAMILSGFKFLWIHFGFYR